MNESPAALNLLSPRTYLEGCGDSDALENVIPDMLPDGALCYVVDQQRLYALNKQSMAPVSPPAIIATALGPGKPGRWDAL